MVGRAYRTRAELEDRMKTVKTHWANIYIGLRAGYSNNVSTIDELERKVQQVVDKKSLCVTVTPTTFIYVKGSEPGAIIGLIHYPRFPTGHTVITETALELAAILKETFCQNRVSVVTPKETYMIGD